MDRQTKLDVLQKELSRKDLSEGCLVKFTSQPIWNKDKILRHFGTQESKIVYANYSRLFVTEDKYGPHTLREDYIADMYEDYDGNGGLERFIEILGHPVILSDVLVWGINKGLYIIYDGCLKVYIIGHSSFHINRDLTKPYLSEQSDEVISGLYEVFLLTKKD